MVIKEFSTPSSSRPHLLYILPCNRLKIRIIDRHQFIKGSEEVAMIHIIVNHNINHFGHNMVILAHEEVPTQQVKVIIPRLFAHNDHLVKDCPNAPHLFEDVEVIGKVYVQKDFVAEELSITHISESADDIDGYTLFFKLGDDLVAPLGHIGEDDTDITIFGNLLMADLSEMNLVRKMDLLLV